jgi:hypothetical protein
MLSEELERLLDAGVDDSLTKRFAYTELWRGCMPLSALVDGG